jgi:hypothetical protein
MHRSIYFVPVIVALAFMEAQVSGADSVSASALARLCEHVKGRKIMYVDRSQPEIIWSDGAMFEIARTFPRELQELIANPTSTRDLRLILKRMSPDPAQGWQEAKIVKSGRGQEHAVIQSGDGKVTLHVASPYFNYVHERYPRARIWTRSKLDAVLFVVDGTLRASVMPIAGPGSAP